LEDCEKQLLISKSREFSTLLGIYGIGTHRLYFFEKAHYCGLRIKVNGCWCSGCVRGKRNSLNGPIVGCVSEEPEYYIILTRVDAEWKEEQLHRRFNLQCVIEPTISIGDIVAIDATKTKKIKSKGWKYDVGRLISRVEHMNDNIIQVELFHSQDGQNFFQDAIPKFTILNFDVLVYRISGIVAEDCQIVLSKFEQQNILDAIFSGINEYKN
jgi:hypothetical protein